MKIELVKTLNGGSLNDFHQILYKEYCSYAKPIHQNPIDYDRFVSNSLMVTRINPNIYVKGCIDEMIVKYEVNVLKDSNGNIIKYL